MLRSSILKLLNNNPSFTKRISEYTKGNAAMEASVSTFMDFVLNDNAIQKASETIIEQRSIACSGCEYLVNEECSKMNCGCPIYKKITLLDAICPENKWSNDLQGN